MTHRRIVDVELEFEREIARSRELSLFRRNPSTWELLLLLAQCENGSNDGVYNTIEAVNTRYLGNSALLKFVRERRDDGLIEFVEHEKKSKWTLRLKRDLLTQLFDVLDARNRRFLDLVANQPGGRDHQTTEPRPQVIGLHSMKDRRE